jgi:hypothetical protein
LCVCASAQSGDDVEWLTAVPDDADAHVVLASQVLREVTLFLN